MDCVNGIDEILDRTEQYALIESALNKFQMNKLDLTQVRGIYIYGAPGSGKSRFVKDTLIKLGYDTVLYDAGDIRNKSIIETITRHNMASKNVLSMFSKNPKPIAIIMDEIDGMNSGDKGGINSLIKLIRPKKTKKQKTEESTSNPIICIGNYHIDKKIKELMKVCTVVEVKTPDDNKIKQIANIAIPNIDNDISDAICKHVQGDLRKLESLIRLLKSSSNSLNGNIIRRFLLPKAYNEDTKDITKRLINNNVPMEEHLTSLNDTDRTIVGLLWHENIIDCLSKLPKEKAYPFYLRALDKICYSDYIDRVTFQKQIWQFNEMSSLMKTFQNNADYHNTFDKKPKYNPAEVRFTKVLTKYSTEYNNSVFIQSVCQKLGMDKKAYPFYLRALDKICYSDYIDRVTFQKQIWQFNEMSSLMKTFQNNADYHNTFDKKPKYNPAEVRFTKVLTKYSTEYNNSVFIQSVCQKLGMDKKDSFSFFLDLRNRLSDDDIYNMFESYEINKLDINRIYRYIDKYTKNDCEIEN